MSGAPVVLGVPIDAVTMAGALDRIMAMVERGRATGRTHQVCTVNVDFVVNALRDDATMRVLQGADLNVADGTPIVWAAALLGSPIPGRVAGADLLVPLAQRCAAAGRRLALYGGHPSSVVGASRVLRAHAPTLDLVTVDAGAVTSDGEAAGESVAALRAHRADIVCVALGNPKQERWIARYRRDVDAPVLMGIGGTLDFIAERTQRAPRWMHRAGLEWVHRAAHEPRRLIGRYARDLVVFGPRIARWIVAHRIGVRPVAGVLDDTPAGATLRLHHRGPTAIDPLEGHRDLVIDAAEVRRLGGAAAARLSAAIRARRTGGEAVTLRGEAGVARSLGVDHLPAVWRGRRPDDQTTGPSERPSV